MPSGGNERQRRLALKKVSKEYIDKLIKKNPSLSKRHEEAKYELEQLQQLERLQQLEQLERLQITCDDYREYKYQDGDIVYLDPPYENTNGYGDNVFNHDEFYNWCASRDYQVWFSSYKISDKRFKMVWARRLRGLMNGAQSVIYNYECLYTNK